MSNISGSWTLRSSVFIAVIASGIILSVYKGIEGRSRIQLISCKANSLQKCTGIEPGFWERGSWKTHGCEYKDFDNTAIQHCLSNKWIHIFGDSTSRHLYKGFVDLLGKNCTVVKTYDEMLECENESFRITYLFRGKVMHQRRPRTNATEESDLHNNFLKSFKPDILVMNVGIHEAIGWTGRPRPSLNFTEFISDTKEFFDFLPQVFNGSLYFWKGHDLKEGKVRGDDFLKARGYYDLTQDHLASKMRQYGATVLDFGMTTKDRRADAGGIHYPNLAKFHANILLNVICE